MLGVDDYIVLVRSLVGCPYAHAGRSRNGVDCLGAAIVPLNEMGIYPPDQYNYSREAFDNSLALEIGKHTDPVQVDMVEKGDILLFWCNRKTRMPQHVAVYIGDNTIVHAYMPVGRVVEGPIGAWSKRITHAFRIPMLLRS